MDSETMSHAEREALRKYVDDRKKEHQQNHTIKTFASMTQIGNVARKLRENNPKISRVIIEKLGITCDKCKHCLLYTSDAADE